MLKPPKPENAKPPRWEEGGFAETTKKFRPASSTASRKSNQQLVASIDKSHSCQLRVSLSTWRGQTKIELADFTSVVQGIYFQAGAGISLDIEKLPELLKAIVAVEREAITRGLLPRRGA